MRNGEVLDTGVSDAGGHFSFALADRGHLQRRSRTAARFGLGDQRRADDRDGGRRRGGDRRPRRLGDGRRARARSHRCGRRRRVGDARRRPAAALASASGDDGTVQLRRAPARAPTRRPRRRRRRGRPRSGGLRPDRLEVDLHTGRGHDAPRHRDRQHGRRPCRYAQRARHRPGDRHTATDRHRRRRPATARAGCPIGTYALAISDGAHARSSAPSRPRARRPTTIDAALSRPPRRSASSPRTRPGRRSAACRRCWSCRRTRRTTPRSSRRAWHRRLRRDDRPRRPRRRRRPTGSRSPRRAARATRVTFTTDAAGARPGLPRGSRSAPCRRSRRVRRGAGGSSRRRPARPRPPRSAAVATCSRSRTRSSTPSTRSAACCGRRARSDFDTAAFELEWVQLVGQQLRPDAGGRPRRRARRRNLIDRKASATGRPTTSRGKDQRSDDFLKLGRRGGQPRRAGDAGADRRSRRSSPELRRRPSRWPDRGRGRAPRGILGNLSAAARHGVNDLTVGLGAGRRVGLDGRPLPRDHGRRSLTAVRPQESTASAGAAASAAYGAAPGSLGVIKTAIFDISDLRKRVDDSIAKSMARVPRRAGQVPRRAEALPADARPAALLRAPRQLPGPEAADAARDPRPSRCTQPNIEGRAPRTRTSCTGPAGYGADALRARAHAARTTTVEFENKPTRRSPGAPGGRDRRSSTPTPT